MSRTRTSVSRTNDVRATLDRPAFDGIRANGSAFLSDDELDIGKLLAGSAEMNAAAPEDKDGKPAYRLSVNEW